MSQAPIADFTKLKAILQKAKNIVVLTGAGVSAESGIPTFRGAGGLWRTYQATELASPGAFKRNPSLVWEFYHHRREVAFSKQPNKAHFAIAEAEKKLLNEGRTLTVVTQNIDGLHQRAGSKNVIELHGSLYKTQCLKCGHINYNEKSPICPGLAGKGAPEPTEMESNIPEEDLPRCKHDGCGGLLRPHIVWFGESLDSEILNKTDTAMSVCDACLVVGTSSVVYPAAMFAPELADKGIPVAEFNTETTPATSDFMFHFSGSCTETLPKALEGIYNTAEFASPLIVESNSITNKIKELRNFFSTEKLKQTIKEYGSTVLVFHIGISLTSLGGFYLAFSSGLDMKWLVEAIGAEGRLSNMAAGASTFVVAYAVHKVFAPIRMGVTLTAAPFIVRFLRKKGILGTPKETTRKLTDCTKSTTNNKLTGYTKTTTEQS